MITWNQWPILRVLALPQTTLASIENSIRRLLQIPRPGWVFSFLARQLPLSECPNFKCLLLFSSFVFQCGVIQLLLPIHKLWACSGNYAAQDVLILFMLGPATPMIILKPHWPILRLLAAFPEELCMPQPARWSFCYRHTCTEPHRIKRKTWEDSSGNKAINNWQDTVAS